MGKDKGAPAPQTQQPGQAPPYGAQQPGYAPQPGYGQPGAVAQQPGQAWMQRPQQIPGVPPGLEYLSQVDQVLVKQQIELVEVLTGFETTNKYRILNSVGQQVYFAAEESEFCQRQCCRQCREFNMHILDNMGVEVIRVFRPCKCVGQGCCGCDTQELTIESPPGNKVASVKQDCACCVPKLTLYDENDSGQLHIEGPCQMCICPSCPCDVEFKVLSASGDHQVGKITKQWSGFIKEAFSDADNFGISFPMDLDVKMKAALIGALFIIDFMFFEQKNDNGKHH